MKKLLILLLSALLISCATTTPPPIVERQFPNVPKELLVACPDLQLVDPTTTKLSSVLSVVKDNYAEYLICKTEVDHWIDWYTKQKEVFNSVK
jgi:hypothetical protein